ncbi:carboxypeptidase-like regulatory domain-containing protein [Tenacibaculum sp. HL-MS23]|uniref:carboxypeptidase-like regulatory domain-containing protein n=1 Tax=Tenacibaculum sp. HL-MS23 TaxID=3077734 RepID=UPI0028FC200B|nr:carboxypeptidase-like regulatory domain-containing protein [Tenacibaculum sp. HL-MS23]WNW02538.1 carboxypeptidase-like regulatory domain-containing protein [Tenacibaculum sp. HL-MS23]
MRKFLFFICYLTSLIIVAQNNAKIVSGTIYLDSLALEDVHIINSKLDIGSVSDKKGRFEILAAKGDVLIISHVNFEYKEHLITEDDLRLQQINIHLDSKTYMLDEIVLKKRKVFLKLTKTY